MYTLSTHVILIDTSTLCIVAIGRSPSYNNPQNTLSSNY